MATPKNSSKVVAGLFAGAVFAVAAGIFFSSKEGKKFAAKLQEKTKDIEKKLRGELKKTKQLTEENYAAAIDKVLTSYAKSKKIAQTEVPAVRKFLLTRLEHIKEEMGKK